MFEPKQSYRDKLSDVLTLMAINTDHSHVSAGEKLNELFREIYDDGYEAGYDKCYDDYGLDTTGFGCWHD